MHRIRTDIQGPVQSMMLFEKDTLPPPRFTYHEFSLTDAVGHDYGPHHAALLDALAETDKRIGKILAYRRARSLRVHTLRGYRRSRHGPDGRRVAADAAEAVTTPGLRPSSPRRSSICSTWR